MVWGALHQATWLAYLIYSSPTLWIPKLLLCKQTCRVYVMKIFKFLSSRLVAGSWWMFVLLMLSCYTANLAAFLTIDKIDSTITSAEDLLRQNKVKVGVGKENNTVLRLLKVGKYLLSVGTFVLINSMQCKEKKT